VPEEQEQEEEEEEEVIISICEFEDICHYTV